VLHACPRAMIADSGEALPNQPPKPYTNRAQRAEKGNKLPESACYDFVAALQITAWKKEIRHAGTGQPPSPCLSLMNCITRAGGTRNSSL